MFTIVFVLVLLAVAAALRLIGRSMTTTESGRHHDEQLVSPKLVRVASTSLAVIAALVLLGNCLTIIPPGHRGVVVTFGKVQMTPLPEGPNLVAPWASVVEVNVQLRKDEVKQIAETADTQSVTVVMLINWRPDPNAVAKLYQEIGPDFADRIIPPASQENLKAQVARHKVTDLIAQRPAIKADVQEGLTKWLGRYDLMVSDVAIGDVDFSDKYDQAIESKQVEEQKVQQFKYELEQRQVQAEMVQTEARGRAQSQIEGAKGEAEALRLRGEAQASYNRKVAESLTPDLVRLEGVHKWDGKYPQVMTSGGGTILQMPMPGTESTKR